MKIRSLYLLLALVACGGSEDGGITDPPPKKPDPYVTVRVRNMLDTTTAPGRAQWHVYAMLTGPYDAQNGVSYQGNVGLDDLRLDHIFRCVSVAADSVGQRFLSVVAFGDTTTEALTPDAQASAMATAWFSGNHNLPAGWMAITFPPTDAWQSAQYLAGHGLTKADPIKWGFDWTESGTMTFYERTDQDAICATF